jgi:hypothetical protein
MRDDVLLGILLIAESTDGGVEMVYNILLELLCYDMGIMNRCLFLDL